MRLRLWHTVAIAAIAVAGGVWLGIRERKTTTRVVLGFDRPVGADVVTRAASLIREHVRWVPATVKPDGDRIAIDIDGDDPWRLTEVESAVLVDRVRFEVRVLEDDALYMRDLSDHMRKDPRAAELGVSAEVDRTENGRDERAEIFLVASDKGQYVNTAWAEKHGCDTSHRIEGTGVYCTVTGKERIEAYVFGDAELFSTPGDDYRPPIDHELLFEQTGTRWRTHYARRAPLELGSGDIADLARAWDDAAGSPAMAIDLRAGAGDEVQAATRSGGQLAIVLDGKLRPARVMPDRGVTVRLQIALASDEEAHYEYAFALHELPARLKLVDGPL